ncbi:hypothetical protein EDC04DRAFT_1524478 [Pisolithus marmoratus]|nr:hypothetical protein EDC04DRAFT_1524478 [Pisolithus marmoratus]
MQPPPSNGPYTATVSYEGNVRAQYCCVDQETGYFEDWLELVQFKFIPGIPLSHNARLCPADSRDKVCCIRGRVPITTQAFPGSTLEQLVDALVASMGFDGGHYRCEIRAYNQTVSVLFSPLDHGSSAYRTDGDFDGSIFVMMESESLQLH